MPELSLHHIDQITRDIGRQDINFSHLLHDLIDHVCCDVENEMQNGLSYSEAYRKVKQKMGSRRLTEIQEETLYEVDTKYRKMKNTMKITGVAGTLLLGFAALFKIMHWPGAGVMMTLGGLILAFVLLPSALVVLWKETHNNRRIFLFISAFFAGMLYILGTMFKIQHWPAAGMLLSLAWVCGIFLFVPALLINRFNDQEKKYKRPVYSIGAAGLIIYSSSMLFKIMHWPLATVFMVSGVIILCMIAFPWYAWLTWKDDSHVKANFIFVIVGILVIIVPGALLNLNLQGSYENGFYSHLEQQQVLRNSLYNSNQSLMSQYRDSLNSREIDQLQSETAKLIIQIDIIKENMIKESEGQPGIPAVNPEQIKKVEGGLEIHYKNLSSPFHPAPVRDFLMPECSSRRDLEAALTEYLNFVSGLTSGDDLQQYASILNPSIYLPDRIPENGDISLISGLHSLALLENSILALESHALSVIAVH
jgi:hypothetical protein